MADSAGSLRRHRSRELLLTTVAAATIAVGGLPATVATGQVLAPVMCSETDVTADGRVFPEPLVSQTFVGFEDFRCGIDLLLARHPELLELEDLGASEGGNPTLVLRMTDQGVPEHGKENLVVINSIHGNEMGAREGALRQIEDLLTPSLLGDEPWVRDLLQTHVVHWVFPNPDGWRSGDLVGVYSRGNVNGTDLNRDYPVAGWIAKEVPQSEVESRHVRRYLEGVGSWGLGTDNHGQGPDTYAAAGLQIVGQFDYQKSEDLARFADGIGAEMTNYPILDLLDELNAATGLDIGPYHWGTLYDMLGYSASGSLIDWYNTIDGLDGFGFATELTVGGQVTPNRFVFLPVLEQVHVDSIRAINVTMFKQALDPVQHVYEVGSRAAYVFDPLRVRHDDANGVGFEATTEQLARDDQAPYDVSRMDFFTDLNRYADRPLASIRVGEVLSGDVALTDFDTVVLANDAMPEPGDKTAWFAALRSFAEGGGNLILTDAALTALELLGLLPVGTVSMEVGYVGAVGEFVDRAHPLNMNLRGVASQTFDTVPIGYSFGGQLNSAPNWKVDQASWEAAGGVTTGINGEGRTIYGELPLGAGQVRILGALLPDPTEDNYHPFGLQSYAVTYTGYTLLQNMLDHSRGAAPAPEPPPSPTPPGEDADRPLPATGGGMVFLGLVAVTAAGGALRRRAGGGYPLP